MEAKHEKGKSMEVKLSAGDISKLISGGVAETSSATVSGLNVFASLEKKIKDAVPESQLYDNQLGLYIPERLLGEHALSLSKEFKRPIARVDNDRIYQMSESSTSRHELFGTNGTIVLRAEE